MGVYGAAPLVLGDGRGAAARPRVHRRRRPRASRYWSQWLWKRLYGRRTDLAGAQVTLGDRTYAIVGVMARDASPTTGPAAWLPLPSDTAGSWGWRTTIVRLKPGVTADEARAELKTLSDALTASRHSQDYPYALLLQPESEAAREVRDIHKAMVGAALAVLLIACVNLAHLMLARGIAKRRELGVRMALGATRWAVIRLDARRVRGHHRGGARSAWWRRSGA